MASVESGLAWKLDRDGKDGNRCARGASYHARQGLDAPVLEFIRALDPPVMIEPQRDPIGGAAASGRSDAGAGGPGNRADARIVDWESKLLEAALEDPVSAMLSDAHRPPEVSGFKCILRLGSGSSGEVWLADELAADRTVALKIMHHRGMHGGPDDLFQREFRLLAKMRHPHLVLLYKGVVTSDGRQGLAMEWIDGWPLDEWLESHPDLSLERKMRLFRGIVAGAAYLHDHGVIHRDLKPANVIVDAQGVAKIVDFGLARLHHEGATGCTDGGTMGLAGTLHFMAPEQAADSDGARAMPVDVFALGVLLYRILTGSWLRPPDRTPAETLALVLNPPPLRLPESARHLPSDLQSILRRALATDPAHRYRHASDLEADLENFAARRPVTARRHTLVYLAVTLLRRQARRSAVAAALVVAGLAAGGTIYHRHRVVAEKNEANLRHAYALASFTLGQLGEELRNANPQIGVALPAIAEFPPNAENPDLPVNPDGQLDLRYFQAQLADLRSAILEGRSHHANALTSIRSALDLYCELSNESPDDPHRLLDAARTRLAFARLMGRVGRDQIAGSEAQKVIRQLDRLSGRPGIASADLLPLRCDATRFLARQAYLAGGRAAAYDLIFEMIGLCENSPAGLQVCPDDGVSPRLAMAAEDLATYAVEGNPSCVSKAMTRIGEVTEILRSESSRHPDSFSIACGLARCLHASARIHLQFGPAEELKQLYTEAAELLIDRPSGAKHLLSSLVREISGSATEWAGMVLNHPDPAVPESAVNLALRFTAHLRRNGDEYEAVLFQRAKIYWFQSRLALRREDRPKSARFISKAWGILDRQHFRQMDDPSLVLLTAQVMHHARSLADLPEAQWNEKRERQLAGIIEQLGRLGNQLTPDQQQQLVLISEND